MSTQTTGALTRQALQRAGARVTDIGTLRDVDEVGGRRVRGGRVAPVTVRPELGMTATEPVDRHAVVPVGGRIRPSFNDLFTDALRGIPCSVRGIAPGDQVVPVHEWLRPASHADRLLLGHCRGATLDIGCGPGRMGAHLNQRGHSVLGVDIVREAVEQARRRGVPALRRSVFDPMPGRAAGTRCCSPTATSASAGRRSRSCAALRSCSTAAAASSATWPRPAPACGSHAARLVTAPAALRAVSLGRGRT